MRNKISSVIFLSAMFSLIPNMVQGTDPVQSPFRVKAVIRDQKMTDAFHSDGQFAGADGACSIPLHEKTTLWLFGDTFVRTSYTAGSQQLAATQNLAKQPQVKQRSVKQPALKQPALKQRTAEQRTAKQISFINNSAAIQDIDSKKMTFLWRQTRAGAMSLFLPVWQSKNYYWPGDGFVVDEKLFIVEKLIAPKNIDAKNAEALNFEWVSDYLCLVPNPGEPAERWESRLTAFKADSARIHIGTACLPKQDHVYFYTSLIFKAEGTNPHPIGIARLPIKKLLEDYAVESPAGDMRSAGASSAGDLSYWDGNGWNSDCLQSQILFPDGASEMTVTDVQGEPYLVATYIAPLTSEIRMRFAKSPAGPWSQPLVVYECPERKIQVLERKCSVYSAKAHPEFSKSRGEVVVSYCSNPGDLKHYLARPELYYPHIIRVELSPVKGSKL